MADQPTAERLAELLAPFGVEPDGQATTWQPNAFVLAREQLRPCIAFLHKDPATRCDMLVDITAVDYLSYPRWAEERFAVVYLLKSVASSLRLQLKVLLEEDDLTIASIHDRYRNADWLEREAYDQYGIEFQGHPNLKRLLNHHEFEGHPLRKDYPVQRRQHLSTNDAMVEELVARLEGRGFEVLDRERVLTEAVSKKLVGGAGEVSS